MTNLKLMALLACLGAALVVASGCGKSGGATSRVDGAPGDTAAFEIPISGSDGETGAANATGGVVAMTGGRPTGGLTGAGGLRGIGGVIGTGGGIGSGGVAAAGGSAVSAGVTASGGLAGTGGIVATGGNVDSGVATGPRLAVFAGVPSGRGSADGAGATARFYWPYGVAVDGAGNVFVADTRNHTIRKITPAGVVTTLAGTEGLSGSEDGTGAAARFASPSGVAVDGAGNVFVADTRNHTIRKITPAGVVTTLAGAAGSAGSKDDTGAEARFNGPCGVAVDAAGDIFVADSSNHTIRKIKPDGVVTTLAGTAGSQGDTDGTGPNARFKHPQGVAVDGQGNVFVADTDNHRIRKITPTGVVSTLAGSFGMGGAEDGTGAGARFNSPQGVAVDGAGNVFVADLANDTIRKITPDGVVTTFAGTARSQGGADGAGATARFYLPSGVAVDGAGNVFVGDTANNAIRKIAPDGMVTTLAGTACSQGSADGTGAAARFHEPYGVAVDGAGNVFVADVGNNTIRKIGPTSVVTTLAGTAGGGGSTDGTGAAARFLSPFGVAVDGTGSVFVADSLNNTVRKIAPDGTVTTLAGLAGSSGNADGTGAAARFHLPWDVAVDRAGNIFVAGDAAIRKITPDGTVTTLAGIAGSTGSADGVGATARFGGPQGLAVDGAGNVFVADTLNSTIRKITPDGTVTTLAGTAGSLGSADGTGPTARFYWPYDVAVDGAGNVFVADTYNNAIRKISASGVVSTIVGVAAPNGAGNFPGPLPASIVAPFGVAVEPSSGNLYIAVNDAVMVAVLTN